jgi:SAM-dependent methyltransferase
MAIAGDMTDEHFVLYLYQHLLGREPDGGGMEHWTGVLADGTTRSEVLEMFLTSPEFLALQDRKNRSKKVTSEFSHLSDSEQTVLSGMKERITAREELTRPENQAVSDDDLEETSAMAELSAQVWAARREVGHLNPRNAGLVNNLIQFTKKSMQRSLSWYTRSIQIFNDQVAKAVEEQGKAIVSIQQSLGRMEKDLLKLQNDAVQQPIRTVELAVQEQLAPYLEFFRGVSPVVDLGCGRGEFLELLKQQGTTAYGVDSDPYACEIARRKLVKVVEEDMLEHLRQLPDRSLGGIFSARVIEYLPAHLQTEFLALCSLKLKPGAVLVIETTNPDSRQGFGRVSCLDPTYLRPVPPELIKSVLESRDMRDVRISVLAPVEASLAPVAVGDAAGEHARRGQALSGASNRLSTSPTYAVVGWRS